MEEIRKLSTILFADIAGYTSMMQKDEQHALGLLNQFKEIIEAHVPEHQGHIIQYFGDACLLSFESVTNGMACALALQLSLIKQAIPVRIGMHLGEVVFRNNNAFGDGVNIASRIESMGIAGSVIVSKIIHDQFKNKSDFRFTSLGSYHFKNVDAPMQIYALANDDLVIPKQQEMKGKLQDVPGNFFQRLWDKRIPQILTVYILIAWLGMQLFDWALNQFHISPHWAQIFFVTVIGVIPSLLVYLNNRERIHQSQWKLGEKVLFPSNLIVVGVVLFLMFRTVDLGAITKEIRYVDADGASRTRKIIKQEFRKRVILFDFEGDGIDSSLLWLNAGIRILLGADVRQDKAVLIGESSAIPMARKVIESGPADFFVDGTYTLADNNFTISPRFYASKNGKLLAQRSFTGADLFTVLDSVSVYIRQEAGISDKLMEASTDLPLKEFSSPSLKAVQYFCEQTMAGLERAIEEDSTFALASLQLGIKLFHSDVSELDSKFYLDQAFRHRHKLPFDLQYSLLSYRNIAYNDLKAAEEALRIQLEIDPESDALNNNMVLVYQLGRQFEKLLDFTETWFKRDNYAAAGAYADALLLNAKTDRLIKRAKPFLRLLPNNDGLLLMVFKAYLVDQNWTEALDILQKIKLKRPEIGPQLALIEKSIHHQRDHGNASGQYEDFLGDFRLVNWRRSGACFRHPKEDRLLLYQVNGVATIYYPLSDQQIIGIGRDWQVAETFELERDTNGLTFGIKGIDLFGDNPKESVFFLWKIDTLITKAESLLSGRDYENAGQAYLEAIAANPNHYFLKDGLAHVQYVKTKTTRELEDQYQSVVGSYGDRNFGVENGRLFYKRKPFQTQYFPKMELFPISENSYLNLTRQNIQMAFEYKNGQSAASYSYRYNQDSMTWAKNTIAGDYILKD